MKNNKTKEVLKFTKDQILSSKKYKHSKDIVNVVLADGQLYAFDEVNYKINQFMKGKVK